MMSSFHYLPFLRSKGIILQSLLSFHFILNSLFRQVVRAFGYWRVYSGQKVLMFLLSHCYLTARNQWLWHCLPNFREDEYLINMQHTVIPSWYQREGYIKAMANLIEKELDKFDCPQEVICMVQMHIRFPQIGY